MSEIDVMLRTSQKEISIFNNFNSNIQSRTYGQQYETSRKPQYSQEKKYQVQYSNDWFDENSQTLTNKTIKQSDSLFQTNKQDSQLKQSHLNTTMLLHNTINNLIQQGQQNNKQVNSMHNSLKSSHQHDKQQQEIIMKYANQVAMQQNAINKYQQAEHEYKKLIQQKDTKIQAQQKELEKLTASQLHFSTSARDLDLKTLVDKQENIIQDQNRIITELNKKLQQYQKQINDLKQQQTYNYETVQQAETFKNKNAILRDQLVEVTNKSNNIIEQNQKLRIELSQQVDENVMSVQSVFETFEQFNKIIYDLNLRNDQSELQIEQIIGQLTNLKQFIHQQLEQQQKDKLLEESQLQYYVSVIKKQTNTISKIKHLMNGQNFEIIEIQMENLKEIVQKCKEDFIEIFVKKFMEIRSEMDAKLKDLTANTQIQELTEQFNTFLEHVDSQIEQLKIGDVTKRMQELETQVAMTKVSLSQLTNEGLEDETMLPLEQ